MATVGKKETIIVAVHFLQSLGKLEVMAKAWNFLFSEVVAVEMREGMEVLALSMEMLLFREK